MAAVSASAEMAMFPLGSVLFPGALLQLHVFEPRYRQLVRDILATEEHEFGVALIERGSEVGGGDFRSMTATVCRLVQVAEMPDGRFAVVTIGIRRVQVNHWLSDDPYPRAVVSDWRDVADDLADTDAFDVQRDVIAARVRRINAIASEMGRDGTSVDTDLAEDPSLASFQLCAIAPLGPADQQRLLEASGPGARLTLLADALDDVEAVLSFRLQHESGGEMGTDLDGP